MDGQGPSKPCESIWGFESLRECFSEGNPLKYKIDPAHLDTTIYYINDADHMPVITFMADGSFKIKDKPTTDTKELVKTLMEVVMSISVRNGYASKIETDCDCGAGVAKTTCATWCSSRSKKKKQ